MIHEQTTNVTSSQLPTAVKTVQTDLQPHLFNAKDGYSIVPGLTFARTILPHIPSPYLIFFSFLRESGVGWEGRGAYLESPEGPTRTQQVLFTCLFTSSTWETRYKGFKWQTIVGDNLFDQRSTQRYKRVPFKTGVEVSPRLPPHGTNGTLLD